MLGFKLMAREVKSSPGHFQPITSLHACCLAQFRQPSLNYAENGPKTEHFNSIVSEFFFKTTALVSTVGVSNPGFQCVESTRILRTRTIHHTEYMSMHEKV